MLLMKRWLSVSHRLKCRPASNMRLCGESGFMISIFSSATYLTLLSSTLKNVVRRHKHRKGDSHAQYVIETLMPASNQFMHPHLGHPLLASAALNIPSRNNGLVTIAFMLEDLADLVPNVLIDMSCSRLDLFGNSIRSTHDPNSLYQLCVFSEVPE